MSRFITNDILYQKLKSHQNILLIDVRDPKDFDLWNIYQSVNIPQSKLFRKAKSLPKDREIIIVCAKGNDSVRAANILTKFGLKAVSLKGGLRVWNNVYDIVNVTPAKPSVLKVFQVKRLGKGCLSYVVVLPDKASTIIIDPTLHTAIYSNFLKANKFKLKAVIDTHLHADHVSGGKIMSRKFRVPYLLPDKSAAGLKFTPLSKGLAKIMKKIHFKILETPGHTPESVSIVLDRRFVFTGDTLFLDSVGRSDSTGDSQTSARLLYESVIKTLFGLDDDIFVLPSHSSQSLVPGPSMAATMRYVRRFNAIAQNKNVETFVKLQDSIIPPPASFAKIKQLNTSGKPLSLKEAEILEFGHNFCSITLKTGRV